MTIDSLRNLYATFDALITDLKNAQPPYALKNGAHDYDAFILDTWAQIRPLAVKAGILPDDTHNKTLFDQLFDPDTFTNLDENSRDLYFENNQGKNTIKNKFTEYFLDQIHATHGDLTNDAYQSHRSGLRLPNTPINALEFWLFMRFYTKLKLPDASFEEIVLENIHADKREGEGFPTPAGFLANAFCGILMMTCFIDDNQIPDDETIKEACTSLKIAIEETAEIAIEAPAGIAIEASIEPALPAGAPHTDSFTAMPADQAGPAVTTHSSTSTTNKENEYTQNETTWSDATNQLRTYPQDFARAWAGQDDGFSAAFVQVRREQPRLRMLINNVLQVLRSPYDDAHKALNTIIRQDTCRIPDSRNRYNELNEGFLTLRNNLKNTLDALKIPTEDHAHILESLLLVLFSGARSQFLEEHLQTNPERFIKDLVGNTFDIKDLMGNNTIPMEQTDLISQYPKEFTLLLNNNINSTDHTDGFLETHVVPHAQLNELIAHVSPIYTHYVAHLNTIIEETNNPNKLIKKIVLLAEQLTNQLYYLKTQDQTKNLINLRVIEAILDLLINTDCGAIISEKGIDPIDTLNKLKEIATDWFREENNHVLRPAAMLNTPVRKPTQTGPKVYQDHFPFWAAFKSDGHGITSQDLANLFNIRFDADFHSDLDDKTLQFNGIDIDAMHQKIITIREIYTFIKNEIMHILNSNTAKAGIDENVLALHHACAACIMQLHLYSSPVTEEAAELQKSLHKALELFNTSSNRFDGHSDILMDHLQHDGEHFMQLKTALNALLSATEEKNPDPAVWKEALSAYCYMVTERLMQTPIENAFLPITYKLMTLLNEQGLDKDEYHFVINALFDGDLDLQAHLHREFFIKNYHAITGSISTKVDMLHRANVKKIISHLKKASILDDPQLERCAIITLYEHSKISVDKNVLSSAEQLAESWERRLTSPSAPPPEDDLPPAYEDVILNNMEKGSRYARFHFDPYSEQGYPSPFKRVASATPSSAIPSAPPAYTGHKAETPATPPTNDQTPANGTPGVSKSASYWPAWFASWHKKETSPADNQPAAPAAGSVAATRAEPTSSWFTQFTQRDNPNRHSPEHTRSTADSEYSSDSEDALDKLIPTVEF